VTELRTEEEQLEAIKSWWKSNGTSLVVMIAIAVSAVYGYRAWQNHQIETSEQASALYQQLVEKATPVAGSDSEKDAATSKYITKTLKAEFSDSQYAKYAALLMAKMDVQAGNLDAAITELDWLLENEEHPMLISLANIRKAQILSAQEKNDAALALLKNVKVAGLQVQAAELEGDIYLALNDKTKAREAYNRALDNDSAGSAQAVIRLKLNDLTEEES
jgi:predicted negative regulator of RcsB-dependent stress response